MLQTLNPIFHAQELELVDFNAYPFKLRPLAAALPPSITRLALNLCVPEVSSARLCGTTVSRLAF